LNYADHITQIKQQLGSGEAVSDYTYDAYGNIIKTTLPANSKEQRMYVNRAQGGTQCQVVSIKSAIL